jgi:hypothetical protein
VNSNILLPLDTFASKVAAIEDDCADASVGNVTGSNAVNVFLGMCNKYYSYQTQGWAPKIIIYLNAELGTENHKKKILSGRMVF